MSDCIVCKEKLSETEKVLNMDFHLKCSETVIKEALKMIGIFNDNP